MKKNSDVDQFLENSKNWRSEMVKLRSVLQQTRLDEEFKWRLPCYASGGANIAIIQPFKDFLALMFFKGTLLKDPKKILVDNGPNSRSARRLEFRSVQDVVRMGPTVKAYVREAIRLEASGLKAEPANKVQPMPAELIQVFSKKPKLKKAFQALTPGRQRAYLLHFASAKQSATRLARIEKCAPRILDGKGLADRN